MENSDSKERGLLNRFWSSQPLFIKIGMVAGAALVIYGAGWLFGRLLFHIIH